MTQIEIPKFLQAVVERSPEYYPLFLCAIHTGLRSGELAGLQWDFNGYFLERAGLRKIRFHDLRHTFASLLIPNGEPLAYVKDQLGHSSIKMTVDVYEHLVPGANRQAVNRLPSLDLTVAQANSARSRLKNLVETPTLSAPNGYSHK